MKKTWIFVIIILVVLLILSFIISAIIALFFGTSNASILSGNVALIPIKGEIVSDKDFIFFSSDITIAPDTIELIEKADKNPSIAAMVFEINSPGGSAVASEEIANAIKKSKKIKVAWIREAGASGAYWIASSTDYIVANRMSITGSIGVIASYLEFSGLLRGYNVTYQRMVSGKYKDIGSPFKPLSSVEEDLMQKKLDAIREYFIDEVAKNRKMPKKNVDEIATGLFYLGSEAKQLNLVDELGGKDEVVSYLEKKIGAKVTLVEYKKERGFFESLANVFNKNSFYVGKGIGSSLKGNSISKIEIVT